MGMAVLIAIAYLFSNNRKAVNWKMVGTGLLFQLILAVGILYVPFVQVFFEFIGKGFVKILDLYQRRGYLSIKTERYRCN